MARSPDLHPVKARNRGRQGPVQRNATALQGKLEFLAITDLTPDPRNPRNHDWEQIRAIARRIEAFGFNAPILIDRNRKIVAGHGRCEAAKLLGLRVVPVIRLEHLTEAQAQAYRQGQGRQSRHVAALQAQVHLFGVQLGGRVGLAVRLAGRRRRLSKQRGRRSAVLICTTFARAS